MEFDVSGLTEHVNHKGAIYYRNSKSEIVAKVCTVCKKPKQLSEYSKSKKGTGGRQPKCKQCYRGWQQSNHERIAEYQKQYYKENRESLLEKMHENYEENRESRLESRRQYRNENLEIVAERDKRYYKENLEVIKEKQRQYRKDNKESVLKSKRKYYEENKELIAEMGRRWREENVDKVRAYSANDTARRKLVIGEVTRQLWKEVAEQQEWKCPLTDLHIKECELDHFIACGTGWATNFISNLIFIDSKLNSSKNNRNPFEWILTQPEEIQHNFHTILVPMLAERNNMDIETFQRYINFCFDNPLTEEQKQHRRASWERLQLNGNSEEYKVN